MVFGGGVHVKVGASLVPLNVMLLTKGATEAVAGRLTVVLALSVPLVNVSDHGPSSAGSMAMRRSKKFGDTGLGTKLIVRVTVVLVTVLVVVARPVVPSLPLGVTELAPKRTTWPVEKPSELIARFS